MSLTLLLTCINSSCKIYKNFWFLSYQQIWVFFFPCLVMMESLTRRRMAGSPSSLVFCWKTAGCYLQQRSLGTGFHCPSFSSATSSVALESVVHPFSEHFSSHSPDQTGTSSQHQNSAISQSINHWINQLIQNADYHKLLFYNFYNSKAHCADEISIVKIPMFSKKYSHGFIINIIRVGLIWWQNQFLFLILRHLVFLLFVTEC